MARRAFNFCTFVCIDENILQIIISKFSVNTVLSVFQKLPLSQMTCMDLTKV
jgi:hypothetical protein